MKTRIISFAVCLGTALVVSDRAAANFEVTAGVAITSPTDFYQPLGNVGTWMQIGTFGRCWHPAVVSTWRPYCEGSWEWTDCGWYWVSDESWAWACYHYGTWVDDPAAGWVWIPGVEWAPAWVNWRVGGDYIGWAPCGPSGITIDAAAYVFVDGSHFNDHLRPDNVIFNNPGILSRTSEIKNISREDRQIGGRTQTVMVNNGPGLALVEKSTGHKFTPVSVQKVDETTMKRAPEQIRHRTTEQPTEQRSTQPDLRNDQRPVEPLPKTGTEVNQPRALRPNEVTPQHEVPVNRNLPPERTVPQMSQERTIPQTPSQKIAPTPNKELPGNKLQSPREVVPPNQIPRQPEREVVPPTQTPRQPQPVAPPANAAPDDRGKDKDKN